MENEEGRNLITAFRTVDSILHSAFILLHLFRIGVWFASSLLSPPLIARGGEESWPVVLVLRDQPVSRLLLAILVILATAA
jgi:hypothetical protein